LKKAQEGKGFVSAQKSFSSEFDKNVKQFGDCYGAKFAGGIGKSDDWDERDSATSKMMSNNGRQPGLGYRRRFNAPTKGDVGDGGGEGFNPGKQVVNMMGGSDRFSSGSNGNSGGGSSGPGGSHM
jgi:hypothetical protein